MPAASPRPASRTVASVITFLLITLGSPLLRGEQLEPIFDGKTLNGWTNRGQANFTVTNGEILGTSGKGGHGWLCTTKLYGDFIMELDINITSGNSGVQIRSHLGAKDFMVGDQIEVDPSPRAWSGGLYDQGRRKWLQDLKANEPARKAFKTNEWNHYRIECRGDSIKSWVNGVPATDYVDSLDLDGVIALQVHAGKGTEVRFRNIRLQDLGLSTWRQAWSGENLDPDHFLGKGEWKAEKGMLVGRHAAADQAPGYLVTPLNAADFAVRFKFKVVAGAGGEVFRGEETSASLSGFEAMLAPPDNVGGLFEIKGRGRLAQPSREVAKESYKANDWNLLTVSAHGGRIAIDVNGYRTAELRNDGGRREGLFGLEMPGGKDTEIWIKDVEALDDSGGN